MIFDRNDEGGARRPYLVFIVLGLLVGASAGLFTEPSIPTWYAGLVKPSFTPPNGVFPPAWVTLYVLMGIAAGRVWKITGTKSPEIRLWFLQLFFNFLWSLLFFALHKIGAALAEIALLWLAVLATLVLFWRRDRIAGLLLVPYLAWAGYALALNLAIWRLNGP